MMKLFLKTIAIELRYHLIMWLFGWRKGWAPSIVFWLVIVACAIIALYSYGIIGG